MSVALGIVAVVELGVIAWVLIVLDRTRDAFIEAIHATIAMEREERAELLERIQRPDRPPQRKPTITPAMREERERAMHEHVQRQSNLAKIGTVVRLAPDEDEGA